MKTPNHQGGSKLTQVIAAAEAILFELRHCRREIGILEDSPAMREAAQVITNAKGAQTPPLNTEHRILNTLPPVPVRKDPSSILHPPSSAPTGWQHFKGIGEKLYAELRGQFTVPRCELLLAAMHESLVIDDAKRKGLPLPISKTPMDIAARAAGLYKELSTEFQWGAVKMILDGATRALRREKKKGKSIQ